MCVPRPRDIDCRYSWQGSQCGHAPTRAPLMNWFPSVTWPGIDSGASVQLFLVPARQETRFVDIIAFKGSSWLLQELPSNCLRLSCLWSKYRVPLYMRHAGWHVIITPKMYFKLLKHEPLRSNKEMLAPNAPSNQPPAGATLPVIPIIWVSHKTRNWYNCIYCYASSKVVFRFLLSDAIVEKTSRLTVEPMPLTTRWIYEDHAPLAPVQRNLFRYE